MYISRSVSLILVTYVVGTHWNCLIEATYVHSINECFHHKTGFSQTSQLLFMLLCNEHVEHFHPPYKKNIIVFSQTSQLLFMLLCNEPVEINKRLCSLACTWVTIIDSQFYIIDSLSLDVSLEKMLTWWLPGC